MDEKCVAEYRTADGTTGFTLTEESGYYVLSQWGVVDIEHARQQADALVGLARRLGRRFRVLMPLPASFKEVHPDARRHLAAALLGDDSPFAKWSIYGGSFTLRAMFNLYLRISKVPARLSETREQAVAWLEEP